MRALHPSDLHAAACTLRCVTPGQQEQTARRLLHEAHIADCYRKRLRRAHPAFGHGTLASRCGAIDAPRYCDTAYLRALQSLLRVLVENRRDGQ